MIRSTLTKVGWTALEGFVLGLAFAGGTTILKWLIGVPL